MKQATISNGQGELLAEVELEDNTMYPRLSVRRVVAGKGRLLHHYFGNGQRDVVLSLDEFRFAARLSTSWVASERRWSVELTPTDALVLLSPAATASLGPLPGGRKDD